LIASALLILSSCGSNTSDKIGANMGASGSGGTTAISGGTGPVDTSPPTAGQEPGEVQSGGEQSGGQQPGEQQQPDGQQPQIDSGISINPDQGVGSCGDGVVDQGEECDGTALGGATCASLGWGDGQLTCTTSCLYNTDVCIDTQGNGGYGGSGPSTPTDASVSVGGDCCRPEDPDCLCRDEPPSEITTANGPYQYEKYDIPGDGYGGGTIYYPTNAEPPFAATTFTPPLTGVRIMYALWGPFLASWGIVFQAMDTLTTQDIVDMRAVEQQAAVASLKAENDRPDSPLYGKLADRQGIMGWSMGGGATWITASQDPTLKSAVTMAGHNMTSPVAMTCSGSTQVPSMQLNGAQDMTILGGLGQSDGVYALIPDTTPKLIYVTMNAGHMTWSGPDAAGGPNPGRFTLAFQKTYLEGDQRWKKFLLERPPDAATYETNITP